VELRRAALEDLVSAACRVCSGAVEVVIDLGRFALANSFLLPEQVSAAEPRYPLAVQRCADCTLLQLTDCVDPAVMFSEYLYTPSSSSMWHAHCDDLAAFVRARSAAPPFVVEVGSNDGCFLKAVQPLARRVLGVDPAANIAELARADGIPTEVAFFGLAYARDLVAREGAADVIVGTNVLAHTPDLLDFLRGVATVLAPDGRFVVEVPYLAPLLDGVAFDTIYHEHVSYFSVQSLANVYERAGLRMVEVEPVPTHGGSLRAVAVRADSSVATTDSVRDLLAAEAASGLNSRERILAFDAQIRALREQVRAHFAAFRRDGVKVAGYGATAKGNTLLGYLDFTPEELPMIGDRSPLKQGRVTPGTHIPVVSAEALEAWQPDVLFLLAWNLADEIRSQFDDFARGGGRFLVPIPRVELVGRLASASRA